MDLNELLIFARVVDSGSFTAAGRALDMPKSTVSRKVSELEERLGARLLHRTTRRLNLTDVGRTFYAHAARVVQEAEEAEQAVARMQETPRGILRVTMPLNFAPLGPLLSSFMKRYPEVQLEVVCADRVVDLVEEGFDVAIRAGRLADSSLIARPLGLLRHYAVASPAFLRKHGTPKAPRDLEALDCVVFGARAAPTRWTLKKEGKAVSVDVRARLLANDFDIIEDAALAGVGVALLPGSRSLRHIRAKRLRRVLGDWCSEGVPVHAVYPSTRHLPPKVSAFLDQLRDDKVIAGWDVDDATTAPRP